MKKIPCLFRRDFTDQRNPKLLREVTPGCEWVLAGEGMATRKWDGTACAIIGGKLHARYDAKRGKTAPVGAIPIGEPDAVTGHHPHWILADRPEDKWIREAFTALEHKLDGTYEAVGPKINSNHERMEVHALLKHDAYVLAMISARTWDGLREYLTNSAIEGIVFHHADGRMAKIRRDDYGLDWTTPSHPAREGA